MRCERITCRSTATPPRARLPSTRWRVTVSCSSARLARAADVAGSRVAPHRAAAVRDWREDNADSQSRGRAAACRDARRSATRRQASCLRISLRRRPGSRRGSRSSMEGCLTSARGEPGSGLARDGAESVAIAAHGSPRRAPNGRSCSSIHELMRRTHRRPVLRRVRGV